MKYRNAFQLWKEFSLELCPNVQLDCIGELTSVLEQEMRVLWNEGPTLNRREIDDECLLKIHGSPRTPHISFISHIGILWLLLQMYYLILRTKNLHGPKSQLGCLPSACDSRTVIEDSIEMCLVGGRTNLSLKLTWSEPTKEIGFICE